MADTKKSYSLSGFERLENLSMDSKKTKSSYESIKRVSKLFDVLGHKIADIPAVHVAGSKGKSSVSYLLAKVLKKANLKVGLFVSPHIHRVNERISINGEPIGDRELKHLIDQVLNTAEKAGIPLTYYETTLVCATLHFVKNKVDLVVLETGLGGRLDATTLCKPILCLITFIELDHTGILGNTVELIAKEKAGIIKRGVPVVSAKQQEGAYLVIKKVADELGAPFSYAVDDIEVVSEIFSENYTKDIGLSYRNKSYRFSASLSVHISNFVLCFSALRVLSSLGYKTSLNDLFLELKEFSIPGRIKVLVKESGVFVVDGCHTKNSAQNLRKILDNYFVSKPTRFFFGATKGHDFISTAKALYKNGDEFVCMGFDNIRSVPPKEIFEKLKEQNLNPINFLETLSAKQTEALFPLFNSSKNLVCAGSLLLVDEFERGVNSFCKQQAQHPHGG